MGAIINRKQFDRVCGYIEDGLGQKEGRVVLGGLPPATGPLAQGYFVQPTVFADVRNDWRIAREEIFGPVMVAIPWDDERDAIRMANDTHYGLAAYVWTHDIGKALTTAHAIESGGSRSTRAWVSLRDIPTAASSRAGSAASFRSKACWTASRSARA